MLIESESPVEEAYTPPGAVRRRRRRASTTAAQLILTIYDDFYSQLCEYPHRAQRAFEDDGSACLDPNQPGAPRALQPLHRGTRTEDSRGIPRAGRRLAVWDALDRLFMAMIVDRYDADIAFSFAHSIRRNIGHGLWRPVAYSFPPPSKLRAYSMASVHRRLRVRGRIDAELLCTALQMPEFLGAVPRPAGRCAKESWNESSRCCATRPMRPPALALDVIEAGFFRDRSAFIVGRWVLADDGIVPFVVALLNSPEGIYADAVLHRVSDIHDLFSSALANFHVTTRLYYQTCVFLFSLMPRRPFGHQYSTIGFNHVGKVAILNEINEQVRARTQTPALARRARHRRARIHVRRLRVPPESHSRSADQLLQVGRLSGSGGGHRQVSRGARDQPGRQHVGQRHVLQSAARSRHVRAGAAG